MIVSGMESLSPFLHLLVLRRCCSLPILAARGVQRCKLPEHQAHSSSKPLQSSSSWGISLASSLGLLNLNSHLLGVLLQLVKCHPLTQDVSKKISLLPPFGQAFCSWNKASFESLGWGGVKGKKSCILGNRRDLVFQVTEIMLGVELVESPFDVQKDSGFPELSINQG